MMDKIFDLQLFAEDEQAAAETSAAASNDNEQNTETTDTTPIPDDLDGIPEDIARGIMQEAGVDAKDSTEDEQDGNGESNADADSDNKHVDEPSPLEQPNQKVPYARFKQEVEKKRTLEEQLAAYKAKYGDMGGQQNQQPSPQSPVQPVVNQQPPAPVQPPSPPQIQNMKLNEEAVKQIELEAKRQAMQMTGMTQEEVGALDYTDQNDSNTIRWNTAVGMARNIVYNSVNAELARRQQASYDFMRKHEASVADYNNFYRSEAKESDFDSIQSFARGEYYKSKSDAEKQILADANMRIERNTASPQDIYCIKAFYTEAKKAYRANHPAAAVNPPATKQTETKIKKANQHPRSEQISGTATTAGEGISVDTLQRMLETKNWDDIPKEYQDILLNGGNN